MTPEEQQAADAAAKAAEEAKATEAKAAEEAAAKAAEEEAAAAAAASGTPPAGTGEKKPLADPAGETEAAKRYSELTARTKAAEQAAKEATERERLALEALERLGRPAPPKPAGEQEPVEPTAPEWDGDPVKYQQEMAQYARDLSGYSATKAAKAAVAEEAAKRARETQAETTKRVQAEWSKRRIAAISQLPDYESVAENPNLKISETMAGAITTDVDGPYVAHYLGQNLAEADRIAALPPGHQLVEYGVIKAKLVEVRRQKTVTQAKPPINKPQGSGTTTQVNAADLPMDEYAKRREEQIASERKRPGSR